LQAIEVINLIKKYDNITVLDDLNLNINEGEFYCLMGPNGSGKTTLSSIIASIRKPTGGEVKIFGKKPGQSKRLIGYIPQENFSDPNLTGLENIHYFARMLGYSNKDSKAIAQELLTKVGLFDDRNKRVSKFSGGMRKKLELSTILFPHIKIFILDEPTTGLDPAARRNFFGLIDQLKDKSTTVLLISHIGSDAELATRVGLIVGSLIKSIQGSIMTGVGIAVVTSAISGVFFQYSMLPNVLQKFAQIWPMSAANSVIINYLIGDIGYNPLNPLYLSLTIIISLLFFSAGIVLYTVFCWRSE